MLRLRIVLLLYRQIYPITVTASLLMWYVAGRPTFESENFLSFITKFFWLRSLAQLLIWYLFRLTNRKGFVFYHHFGFSEIQLAIGIYVIEILGFIVWLYLAGLLLP